MSSSQEHQRPSCPIYPPGLTIIIEGVVTFHGGIAAAEAESRSQTRLFLVVFAVLAGDAAPSLTLSPDAAMLGLAPLLVGLAALAWALYRRSSGAWGSRGQ